MKHFENSVSLHETNATSDYKWSATSQPEGILGNSRIAARPPRVHGEGTISKADLSEQREVISACRRYFPGSSLLCLVHRISGASGYGTPLTSTCTIRGKDELREIANVEPATCGFQFFDRYCHRTIRLIYPQQGHHRSLMLVVLRIRRPRLETRLT